MSEDGRSAKRGETSARAQGCLVLCPTPVGNLEDITLRALRALRESDVILAEDTRVSQTLLRRYEIATPLRSFHEAVEPQRIREMIALLAQGKRVALVSDAGTPGIADPGSALVRAAREAGAAIEVLPGPTAVVGALVLSGFDVSRFRFEGFAPRKPGQRAAHIAGLADVREVVAWYESPQRVRGLLEALGEAAPARRVFVLREYTKKFEEQLLGTAAEVLARLVQPRGEFVVVWEGAAGVDDPGASQRLRDAESALRALLSGGTRTRLAVDAVAAATGMRRNDVYDIAERLTRDGD